LLGVNDVSCSDVIIWSPLSYLVGEGQLAAVNMSSAQRVQWLIRVLCVLGICVAGYLAWTHLTGTDPYCGIAHNCADVQNSSYSEVAGIPVAIIGLVGYAVLLALNLLRGHTDREVEFYLPVLGFGVALIGVLYSAYLTYLEAFVIHAWCYWCVASAAIITAVWVLSVYDLWKAFAAE
jgi:uncharacterized membrane protein